MAPTGWRKAALGFTLASTVTLLLNAAFIVWATANDARSLANGGIGVLITGSCAPVKELNVGIHIVINILSTVLLAGSNYCMQVLSAPDRELVDFAYEERWRLEIGIPSLGNIKHIGKRRRRLWWAIGLLSISLHLL